MDWEGSRDADGRSEGFGTDTYSNGGTHTGEFRGGRRHGPWVAVCSDGSVYDQVWNNGAGEPLIRRVSYTPQTTTTTTTVLLPSLH